MGAKSLQAKKEILRDLLNNPDTDADIRKELLRLTEAWDSGYEWAPVQVIQMIEMRARVQPLAQPKSHEDPKKAVQRIKANPLYRDPGEQESSNWLSRSATRFGELTDKMFGKIFRNNNRSNNTPDVSALGKFMQSIGPVLKFFVYLLLAGLLGLFVYLVARHFRWKSRLSRKAVAVLDEDEPERSRDEWLEMASKLTAEGKYREAVRCLYLASLLRFDEAGVARFIRTETNWEHLRRINASPSLPEGLDFTEATQAFDSIWYGFRIKGISDVEHFRRWYEAVTVGLGLTKEAK